MTEKPRRFTEGKHPIEIGGIGWQVIKMIFTSISVFLAAFIYLKHWLFVLPAAFFGFIAFNFWYVEYQVFVKNKKLGWGN